MTNYFYSKLFLRDVDRYCKRKYKKIYQHQAAKWNMFFTTTDRHKSISKLYKYSFNKAIISPSIILINHRKYK